MTTFSRAGIVAPQPLARRASASASSDEFDFRSSIDRYSRPRSDRNRKDILARHLAACPHPEVRNGERALELALEVYEQVPSLESVETLAMAHAEIQDFEEAIRWQQRALEKAATTDAGPRREHLERNLERYRQGLTCCADR